MRRAAESCALAGLNFLAGLTGLSFGLKAAFSNIAMEMVLRRMKTETATDRKSYRLFSLYSEV